MRTIAGIITGIIISFGSYKIYKSFSMEDRRLIEGTKELETSLRINESLAIDYLSTVDEGSRASALLPLKNNLDSDIRMYEMRLADVMGSDSTEFNDISDMVPPTAGREPEFAHLRSMVGLVWRAVVMWMVLLALLTLARLVG